MDESEPVVRNKVVAGSVEGPVILADSIGSVTVVAGQALGEWDAVVEVVAQASADLWRGASRTWEIHPEAPVRVSWSRDEELSVEGREGLLSEGLITRLHDDLYDQPLRRQLVLVGEAGTGKTSAMYLLLKEVLDRREQGVGLRAPVPLWLTMSGWDPDSVNLTEYAVRALTSLPGLRRRDGLTRRTAGLLVERGRVALFLDGLDEMPSGRRGKAVEQINLAAQGGTRVVLSTKPGKRGAAKDVARFRWPVVIRMNPVDVRTAAEFLVQGHTGQDREPWVALAEHLVGNPRSALADALRTPLTINLARHAFPQAGTSAEKPLDLVSTELDTARKITTRLMSLYLDRAYSTAGVLGTRAAARVTARHARERATLTWLAGRLGAERDIAWWRIPREVDRGSLRLRNGLVVAACVLAITLTGYVLTKWPEPWWTAAIPPVVAFFVVRRFTPPAVERAPATLVWARPSWADVRRTTRVWVLGGLLFGGIAAVKSGNPWALLAMVGVFVVMGLLGAGYGQGISGGLLAAATKDLRDSPMVTPHDAFRADLRRTAVAALVGAVAGSTLMGLLGFFDDSIGEGILWGGAMGLATGWLAGLGPAWLLLAARPDVPRRPARLMPTLRSALDKQVLRQVGLVYQFRHAELQIHLQQNGQVLTG